MNFARFSFSLLSLLFAAVMAQAQSDLAPAPLVITEVPPVRLEQRGAVQWADFGQDAYGSLRIQLPADVPSRELKVRLGEKLDAAGAIDRQPGGSVNYCELSLPVQSGQTAYQLQLPAGRFPAGNVSKAIPGIGEIEPFRYAEIEGLAQPLEKSNLCQLFVHAPFDDNASFFECSDETLNAVWHLCKHTMKATTAFGIYIDGNRERTPYEADAYINMLSHYACDLDPRVARNTFAYLLNHPTWPTEWSLHMPMIAAEDYLATGDPQLAQDHYDALKKKLMMNRAREDGLLRATAIVDWPPSERDDYNDGKPAPGDSRQIGPVINTVANAFYYHALREMAMLARALKKEDDARHFETSAAQVYKSFKDVFFDEARGVYI
ncbi:MAG TPA: acetylglucosamine-6-sulfatase, partial [Verrucomicrobiae bacterium]|nr:acetylglucosamine-6-sulfatase [Verrucomicrobiae bacterium]